MKASFDFKHAETIGFQRSLLLFMLTGLTLGGILLGISLVFHSRIHTRYLQETINERQPHQVLVTVAGTPTQPGYVGFLAEIQPNTNVLTVVPIPGNLSVSMTASGVPDPRMPLWQAASQSTPKESMAMIQQATHLHVSHYFFLTTDDLQAVLHALYHNARGWPKTETVDAMLNVLGYPQGTISPAEELNLLQQILHELPQMSPLVASSLITITKTAQTNLTGYQLFQLANYIRGDSFRIGRLPAISTPQRGRHGQ